MASRDLTLNNHLRRAIIALCVSIAIVMVCFNGRSLAWLIQSGPVPQITSGTAVYDPDGGRLIVKGQNFQKGATVSLRNQTGPIAFGSAKVKGSTKVVINQVAAADLTEGVDVTITNPDGVASAMVHITVELAADESKLTADDVKKIIAQAATQADLSGLKVTIAVTDKEGNILGIFRMNGARSDIKIGGDRRCSARNTLNNPICGLDGLWLDGIPISAPFTDGAALAAISKAVTGAFLSSQGHSFTTRTASFIVQEHFPPGVKFQGGGPLFGVQFSQFLICSDINARSPLGLSADPGGIALYKNGIQVGGVGVEGDGAYALDLNPADDDQPVEELIALAATRGFETPPEIQGDKIIVNGIRFPFVNTPMPPPPARPTPFDQLRGVVLTLGPLAPGIRDAQPSRFTVATIDSSAPAGRIDSRFFPFNGGSVLSKSDVQQILAQAARQAFITRAAIRQPLNSAAEVNISVVDVDGTVLGIFSTIDAPIFGFDVCVQKARTAAFFSNAVAAQRLRSAGFGSFVDAAAKEGLKLDGSVAFTDRAGGFLSRPFFPDGIDETEHGPFSVPMEDFSPFNDGLQLDLVLGAIGRFITAGTFSPANCTGIPNLPNGTQIFPGSVPLYKNGKLAGAIGVSGDGVDQDDLISTMGSAGFEAPADIRADRVFVRGVRLPYVKFPRHPNR